MSKKTQTLILSVLAAAYLCFLTLDLFGEESVSPAVKYGCILLLAGSAVLRALADGAGASEKLTAPALCLTAAADWLLLLKASPQTLLPGVAIFLAVQLLYAARLQKSGAYPFPAALAIRLAAAALGLFAGLLLTEGSAPGILAGLYFSQLLSSAVLETLRPRERFFAPGLWLFVGCDICVGLHNLPALLPEKWAGAVSFGMWLFYLPSQVLIVFSAGRAAKKSSGRQTEGENS